MLLRRALLAFCLLGLQSCESRHEISACITRDGLDRRYGTLVSQLLQLSEQFETRHHTVWAKVLFDYPGLLDETKQLFGVLCVETLWSRASSV